MTDRFSSAIVDEPVDPPAPVFLVFLADLITILQSLVAEYHLPAYKLIVNGGESQEFPQLHFHLISNVERSNV